MWGQKSSIPPPSHPYTLATPVPLSEAPLRAEEELESLTRRGSEAVDMLASSSAPEDEAETAAFKQLQTVQRIMQARRQ